MPFYSLYKNLIISQGRADLNMWLNISQIVLQFVLIFATYQQGILMVVYAYSILNVVWLLAWQFFAHRMIGLRLVHVLKDTLPFALISGAVMVASHFATMQFDNVYLLLTLRMVMAAVLYVGIMKLLRVKIMDECIKFLFKKMSK